VYHLYTVRTEDRDGLQASMLAEGIQTAVHYAVPAHLQPAYADLGYEKGSLPEAEAAAAQVLSLPIYPELTEQAIVDVTSAVKRAMSRRLRSLV
jgi:dTDP-4-amino-4,6-dideoxygalactose transaminase